MYVKHGNQRDQINPFPLRPCRYRENLGNSSAGLINSKPSDSLAVREAARGPLLENLPGFAEA